MNLEKRQNEELIQRTWGIVLGMPPFVVLVLVHQWTLVGVFMFISFLAFQEYWKMASEERVSFPIWFSLYPLIL
ncbi:MAG: phosphatidate cytidylyltransferase, partial [Candidatus Caldatribacteriaceae bacterium]